MAAEKILKCRGATHGVTDINNITHAQIMPTATSKIDQGDASAPGPSDAVITDRRLRVQVMGTDWSELIALVGATAANLVLQITGASGANEKITIKNVYFSEIPSQIDLPEKDAGGKLPTVAITGEALWGSTDTFATMIVGAADS
jgi:hypothetical protein